ncbi:uncharacterized protein P174DRAFT_464607 [Aspergillus novofumigatus IBT 16806]|uniref:Uncharacterized protein n=1 Tax=Aspergillus novofumigatus (strain IBT 16806) TaxID=1392255 RepID=A0A2I1BU13_ASPN1|nr:uncharacterized protein P174DRAFT_464607 [Aspergillus novofumigatus IBT 16806]PKX88859.1 hypothetical protein P174DRAFT_464607 [Aspergillus novofumigatus IBT 16806]
MVPFLKWLAELFLNVFQCFPTSRTSHRELGWFGADLVWTDPELSPEAAVWHHDLDDVIKVIVPLPCQDGHKQLADLAVDKDGVKRVLSYFEAVRSLPLGSKDPMVVAQELRDLTLKRVKACKQLRDAYCARLGIGDMILAEVQLEDPSNGYAPAFLSHHPAGAILVDLAVLLEHAATVCSKYLPVKFAPFSGHDPLVWSEPGDIDLQRALAFRRALSRYDKAQRIRHNWFSKRMTELEGLIKAIYGCEAIRVWCYSHQEDPMASVQSNYLHDVVRAAVPLQDPDYQRVAEDKTVYLDRAILVDLAVYKEGVRMVLHKYGVIDFVPMSNNNPVVLSQPGETMEYKQVAAYKNILERYSYYLHEECRLLGPMAKVWTIYICCPKYKSHPWEIIQELELVQVDLAVNPSGISRVHHLYELVEFQRLSEADPIIQMIFNGYSHIL